MRIRLSIFLCFLISIYIPALCSSDIHAHKFTTINGLSSNSIRYLYQDKKGFIWMTSLNGLNRYDGQSFTAFYPDKNVPVSLADRRTKFIEEDRNGFLWISSSASIFSCYDPVMERFVDFTGCGEHLAHFDNIVLAAGEIWQWGKRNGCRRIIYNDGHFTSEVYNTSNGLLNEDDVQFVAPEESGVVWIATNKGLYKWEAGSVKHVHEGTRFLKRHTSSGKSFFLSTDGNIWLFINDDSLEKVAAIPDENSMYEELTYGENWIIFTSKGGGSFNLHTYAIETAIPQLNIIDGRTVKDNRGNDWVFNNTGKLRYINKETSEIKELQLMSPERMIFIDSERYHIIADENGNYWISTYGNGLFRYNPEKNRLENFTRASNPLSIPSDFLHHIMIDRTGSLWVGTEYAGVSLIQTKPEGTYFFHPETNQQANRVEMIAKMNNGEVWISTRNGKVHVYNPNSWKQIAEHQFNQRVYGVCENADGVKWIGTRGGGLIIEGKNYIYNANDSTSISSNEIFSMLNDSKGRIWIGTLGGGLNLAVKDQKKGYIFRRFFNATYGQSRIRSICEDYNGWIWLGTSDGLFVFHPDRFLEDTSSYYTYNWHNSALHSSEVRFVMQDSKHNIWISETGSGFSVCTPENDYANLNFTHYNTESGLVNNMVQALSEDSSGMIWVSTEYGVSCFNPLLKTFENYFFSDDFFGNVHHENSVLYLQNNTLIFGTNNGAVVLNPERVREKENNKPMVDFVNMSINGVNIQPGAQGSPLEKSITYTEHVKLKYNQESFVINFSILDFSYSPKYTFFLENYDRQWSIPSERNFAAYNNLLPGTYYLHVKAIGPSGLPGEEKILKILITPPFWLTTWALLLYTMFAGAIIYLVYRYLYKLNALNNKIKIEEQLTEYKLGFFTNISHEFRTPLALIRNATEKIQEQKLPEELHHTVNILDKSTQRLLRLVNQLLEFRKIQIERPRLALEEIEVISLVHNIFVSFKELANTKEIKYSFHSSVDAYKMYVDKDILDKIVYNLISNAFKYTEIEGEVAVKVELKDEIINICVSDNGIGVSERIRSKLFKQFIYANSQKDSLGIGLYLASELAKTHKGEVSYDANPSGGSVFTLILPTEISLYEKSDFISSTSSEAPALEVKCGNREEQEQEVNKEQEEWEQENETESKKPKILLIEDDPDINHFLERELGAYFEVVTAFDGNSGLDLAYTLDIDLIISDVMMPGYSGFEVTHTLKTNFGTSHIPIILLTALDSQKKHIEGLESGADAYITKPFSFKILLTTIYNQIRQRDILREKFPRDLSVTTLNLSTNNKDKEFLEKLNQIINQQLDNPEFSVSDFAAMMALGRTVFFKKVRGITGYSPKEYLRVVRMKKGAELILTTDATMAEVAYQVGISDPFYFSRCFKTQFGIAPSSYKKKMLQKAKKDKDEN